MTIESGESDPGQSQPGNPDHMSSDSARLNFAASASQTSGRGNLRRWLVRLGVVGLTVLLALYLGIVLVRAVELIRTGVPVAVALGVAFAVIPLMIVMMLIREWRLALETQSMADELAAVGELPVDDLPRSKGGRIDREAAVVALQERRTATQISPESWQVWYHLAFAHDAAGERARARRALRTAARIRRTEQ